MNSSESTVASSSVLSENDILLEKALLAGHCKNFIGTGPRKISKAEIKELNISKLAKTVSVLVEDSSLPFLLSSTCCLGMCRIYEKSVDFILEDLQKFNDELNTALLGVQKPKPPSKPKKNEKSITEQDKFLNISNQSFELCEEGDFIPLFGRNIETDQYLLHEIDVPYDQVGYSDTLGDFGDEIHLTQNMENLRGGPSEWLSSSDDVAQLGQSIINSHQILDGGVIYSSTPAVIPATVHQATSTEMRPPRSTTQSERRDKGEDDRPIASTPKRKTHQTHDETPTKRPRKSPSLANGHSKESTAVRRLFDQGGQSSSTPANTEDRSSAARRLFGQDVQNSSTPAHEIMLDRADGNEAEPFPEPMPSERHSEELSRSSSHQVHSDQYLEQGRESMPLAAGVLEDTQQLQPNQLLEDINDMELGDLEELNNESLTPKRPKRLKKWMQMDEENKIPLPLNIDQRERYIEMHTRRRGSTLVNPHKKESVVDLFSLPATRFKPKGSCCFGKPLLKLYFEMARPILHTNDKEIPARLSLSSVPRDTHVNKRRLRFSSFGRDPRQRPSVPSMSGDQNITSAGDNSNNEDRDRELMPPPLTPGRLSVKLPEIHVELLSLPSLDQQQQSPQQSPKRQLPGTPTKPSIRSDTPAVSPRQSPSVANNLQPMTADTPDDNFNNHPNLPFEARRPGNDDSDPQSHHVIERSPSSLSITSERERSSLMKEDEFYQFLKNQWAEMLDTVDLRSIIPRRPTPVAFFRYFVFLQRLQKQGKLMMLQEIIYGPVHIVRERTKEVKE